MDLTPLLLFFVLLPAIAAIAWAVTSRRKPEPGSRLCPVAASVDAAMMTVGVALCRVGHSVRWRDGGSGTVAGTCRRCGGGLTITEGPVEATISADPILATDTGTQPCSRTSRLASV
jgi:hypothetical protein